MSPRYWAVEVCCRHDRAAGAAADIIGMQRLLQTWVGCTGCCRHEWAAGAAAGMSWLHRLLETRVGCRVCCRHEWQVKVNVGWFSEYQTPIFALTSVHILKTIFLYIGTRTNKYTTADVSVYASYVNILMQCHVKYGQTIRDKLPLLLYYTKIIRLCNESQRN